MKPPLLRHLRLLTEAGQLRFRIISDSMRPTLRAGDIVHIDPALPCRPGDLVAFMLNGALTCHRLVRQEGNQLFLRGDAAPQDDSAIEAEAVLGRVIRIESSPFWNRSLWRARCWVGEKLPKFLLKSERPLPASLL